MIKKDEVRHIASLARIGMNDEEVEKFSHDLSSILDWVEELKKVNTENVETTSHVTGLKNRMREDFEHDFENKEGIRNLFPEEKNGYNKVKSVL